MKRTNVFSGMTLEHVQFSAEGRSSSGVNVNLLLLVLAPMGLRGAKVLSETESEPAKGFVLDRSHPVHADHIWVAQSDVVTAMVPECCWAAEDASAQERLYAAYNLGGHVDRAGIAWDKRPCPTWAELLQRAHDGEPGAAAVIAKWEAVAQSVDQMGDFRTFGWALRQLKNGHQVRRTGWKETWLSLTPGQTIPAEKFWSPHNRSFAESNGGKADVLPSISLKMANGQIMMGWTPNVADLLAEDWEYTK